MKAKGSQDGGFPAVIPPGSVVRLLKATNQTPLWKKAVGETFTVGYYSRKDGLDVIWLVNIKGDYCQTVDRKSLLRHFTIVEVSSETNLYEPGGQRSEKRH